MRVSIAHMRAAGLSAEQIVKVLEEADAERRQKARIIKRKQRSRPPDRVDTQDTEDKPYIDTSSRDLERKKSKKVSIAADWKPTDADRDYARAKGWPDARIDTEAERFRIHYLANTKAWADWHLVWCKWVISSFQTQPKQNLKERNREIMDDLDGFIQATTADAQRRSGGDTQTHFLLPLRKSAGT